MIRLTKDKDHYKLYIKQCYSDDCIKSFLLKKGYFLKSWLWKYEDTTFPNGTTKHEQWTFTATKDNQPQSENNIYTVVFEKEIKKAIKLN